MLSQHVTVELGSEQLSICQDFCSSCNIRWENFCLAAWAFTWCTYTGDLTSKSTLLHAATRGQVSLGVFGLGCENTATVLDAVHSLKVETPKLLVPGERWNQSSDIIEGRTNFPEVMVSSIEDSQPFEVEDVLRQIYKVSEEGPWFFYILIKGGTLTLRHGNGVMDFTPPSKILATFRHCLLQFASSLQSGQLKDLEITSPGEREGLQLWNSVSFHSTDRCVHEVVDEHALRTPYKEAVVATNQRYFTYQELSDLSTRLAVQLGDQGVFNGDIVPILFEKSPWATVAALAIMKAGAAYVGFSPDMPISVLSEATKTAGARVVLTTGSLRTFAMQIDQRSLLIEDLLQASEGRESHLVRTVRASDLAYVVFTSGSTGIPKAAMIEHSAALISAKAQQRALLINRNSRVLQFAAYNFDAFNLELITTLVAGATLCIPTEHERLHDLAGAINSLEVNYAGMTPSLARILHPQDVIGLKTFAVWGEAPTQDIIDRWAPYVDLVNGYGPSETSPIFSANNYSQHHSRVNNIGPAMENAAGWVVSPHDHHKLVPAGAVGELLIQGSMLGRGYLGQPATTNAVFISKPDWMDPSTPVDYRRLYKTGDLVRQMPDKSFEYYGRRDKQVKVNGQRLELGEVEYRLNLVLNNGMRSAVELLRPQWADSEDHKILVAFLSSKTGPSSGLISDLLDTESQLPDTLEMTTRLTEHLKPYAIPRAFLLLRTLPTTTQGKLDRKKLQILGASIDRRSFVEQSSSHEPEDPVSSPMEFLLQKLFSEILAINPTELSRSSDFLRLGGDSIRAMKLISLAKKHNLNVTVPDVLRWPKLAVLAQHLKTPRDTVGMRYYPFDSIKTLKFKEDLIEKATLKTGHQSSSEIADILPATDLQASCCAWSTFQSRAAINWLVFKLTPPQNIYQVSRSCEELVNRHSILRTAFVLHNRQLYQVVSKSHKPEIVIHNDARSAGEVTAELVRVDKGQSVDIGQCQTAFHLLCRDGKVERLLMRLAAAQFDGRSVAILSTEMKGLCSMRPLGHADSFQEYLCTSRSVEAEAGLAYWRQLLHGSKMTEVVQQMPGSFFHNPDKIMICSTSFQAVESVDFISKATGVKAAWALTLAEMTGEDDVIFGSTVWGRNAPVPSADDVVGACVTHVPIRVKVFKGLKRLDLLRELQSQHITSMRFESLGSNTIVQQCTDWKPWTRCTSLVHYQGIDIQGSDGLSSESIQDELSIEVDEIVAAADRTDLMVRIEPIAETARVTIRYSSHRFSEKTVTYIMDRFLWHLATIYQDVTGAIVLQRTVMPPLPCESQQSRQPRVADVRHGATGTSASEPADLSRTKYDADVEEAWSSALGLRVAEVYDCRAFDKSFLEIWGNVIAAYALVEEYRAMGYALDTEDLLVHQTMRNQRELLRQIS